MYKKYRDYVRLKVCSRDLLEQLAEESSELAQAALKLIRADGMSDNPTPVTSCKAMMDLFEEVGDVMMLWDVLGLAGVETSTNEKWERWALRLGREDGAHQEIGISIAHLSKLETAKVNPGLTVACMLADYYGVSLDELLGHEPGTKYIK